MFADGSRTVLTQADTALDPYSMTGELRWPIAAAAH